MQLQVDNRTIDIDDEGYLVDPADWSEAVAEELARRENLRLEPHWRVIDSCARTSSRARSLTRATSSATWPTTSARAKCARKRSFELVPYGYVRQACKVAGMRRPRAWSTG